MPRLLGAISNTTPLLYLYRIGKLDWLEVLFGDVWMPGAVVDELVEGQRRGHAVPDVTPSAWLGVMEPGSVPDEWKRLNLGSGELAAMPLGAEYPERILLLDDGLARRTAQRVGLMIWGTLKVLLEAKSRRLTDQIGPLVEDVAISGMWLSHDIQQRILALAGEGESASR